MYLQFIIYSIILFVFFRVINKILKFLSKKRNYVQQFLYVFPIVEFSVWIGFLIWIIKVFFRDEFITQLVIISLLFAVLIVLFWFVFRDLVTGIVLKIQNKFEKNQIIKFKSNEGIIKRLGYFSFDLKTSDGETQTIPYSQLKTEIIIKPNPGRSLKKQVIKISCPKTANLSKWKELLGTFIANTPWVSAKLPAEYHSHNETNNVYEFEFFIYVLDSKHADLVKNMVQNNVLSM